MKEVRKVHQAYVEIPQDPWVIASGGRCYREADVRENFVEMVKCPLCCKDRWFSSEGAYVQHWHAIHKGV